MLKAIEPIRAENVVLGQYLGSEDGSQPGYKDGESILCACRKDVLRVYGRKPTY